MGDDSSPTSNGILAKIYQEFKAFFEQINYQSNTASTNDDDEVIDAEIT